MVATVRKMAVLSKGNRVGRKRAEPDQSTYGGRIAARVRMLREKAGKTIDELALSVGVTTTTIYRWESGLREIEFDRLPELAAALGVSVRLIFPQE